jgi:hypothetical protein
VLQTANFQNNPEAELLLLKIYQPLKPAMVMEYWSGWFDHWFDQVHHTTSVEGTVAQYRECTVTISLQYSIFLSPVKVQEGDVKYKTIILSVILFTFRNLIFHSVRRSL